MTIAEVADKFNLSTDTLRYYEKINLIPRVSRTGGGIRNYTEYDLGWVEFIKCMRSAGLSIEVLIEYVRLYQIGEATLQERKQLLIKERDALAMRAQELCHTVERLNKKIDNYDNIGLKN